MGSLCSKDRTTVDIDRCVTPGSKSTDQLLPHQTLTYEVTAQADSTGVAAQGNGLPSSLARCLHSAGQSKGQQQLLTSILPAGSVHLHFAQTWTAHSSLLQTG